MSVLDDIANKILSAVTHGDVPRLRVIYDRYPERLNDYIYPGRGVCTVFGKAAAYDQIPVMEYLVNEKGLDVNRVASECGDHYPLHYAQDNRCVRAAAWLLAHGADPAIKNHNGLDTVDFCDSPAVQDVLSEFDPAAAQKQKQKKIDGVWNKVGAKSIVHDYELPDSGLKITDEFNFEAAAWRSVVRDIKTGMMAQSIVPFYDVRDSALLQRALDELISQKGDVSANTLRGALMHKIAIKGIRP